MPFCRSYAGELGFTVADLTVANLAVANLAVANAGDPRVTAEDRDLHRPMAAAGEESPALATRRPEAHGSAHEARAPRKACAERLCNRASVSLRLAD